MFVPPILSPMVRVFQILATRCEFYALASSSEPFINIGQMSLICAVIFSFISRFFSLPPRKNQKV